MLKEINTSTDIIDEINKVLQEYGIVENICRDDITITRNTICDHTGGDGKLSRLINEYMWPNLSERIVYHFTNEKLAKKIKSTQKIRLNDLSSNFWSNEVRSFCQHYNLHWNLNNDGERTFLNSLVKNLFFASFASTDINQRDENEMWRFFGEGSGFRLKLKIRNKSINFRKMHYITEESILKKIQLVAEKFNLKFSLRGISSLCAFGLPNKFSYENEYRLLLNNDLLKLPVEEIEGKRFIELELNKSGKFCDIELLECTSWKDYYGK
ncbi:hypothetical protein [Acinetobacter bereziniae]|uniref:hypothetical protein n=1 Tax=Acinetobacter bereziniae TaxID=106648 RepID=UPI0021E44089|nr:hypothetical protein [Acinetobacter bereziniae]MCV2445540.1 hypothetical protein [Acinetobacter bereziniae]